MSSIEDGTARTGSSLPPVPDGAEPCDMSRGIQVPLQARQLCFFSDSFSAL